MTNLRVGHFYNKKETQMTELKYKRIMLKLSGEALGGEGGLGINVSEAEVIASRVKEVHDMGVEVALVIGAGNLWRGKKGVGRGMDWGNAGFLGLFWKGV